MKFSYNFLQEFVNKNLPEPHELAELLTMHSFEVEEIEKKGQDHILDIDILPNRAHDAASHIGVAREAAAVSGGRLKNIKITELKTDKSKIQDISLNIESNSCGRYMGAIINNVEVKESPKWLKDRLEALGLNPINNIVDAANYAMLATGQPLHAFDLSKIDGGEITVRNAKQGETIDTLDEDAFILDSSMVVIADAKEPLAIAGIKGGMKAEVNEKTKDIFIESAWFEPMNIRSTSQRLGLKTDASWRFEHEMPLTLPPSGLGYAVDLVLEIAGGKLEPVALDSNPQKPSVAKLALRPEYVRRLLGLNLTNPKISSLLKSIEFGVEDKKERLMVSVPGFRLDIEREEDLVEEVGRLFGYENAEPKMPRTFIHPPERNFTSYRIKQIRQYLAASGFNELYTYSFISDSIADTWGFDKKGLLELQNPTSEDFKFMRPSLLPNVAKAVRENLKFFESIEVFEVGRTFKKSRGKKEEYLRLCMAIAGRKEEELFYELKGQVVSFINSLGISDVWFDDALKAEEENSIPYLHPMRRAQIKIGDDILGYIGEIDPRVANSEKLKGEVVVVDLDLHKLIEEAEKEEIYHPISTYPQSVRDISILVPKLTKTDEVLNVINTAGGELLRDVDMFDYYEEAGSEVKSMAFHLVFQSAEKTLKSEEVDELMAKITHEVEDHEGWSIR